MKITNLVTSLTLGAALAAFPVSGQSVISAKAGVVHYFEGEVKVGNGAEATQVEAKFGGRYTEMKDGQELLTGEGRAEVLLNPGVFLRVGENSTIKMISSRLSDTRVELSRGVALVEVAEVSKDNAVTMLVKDAAITFSKMGLVRMDANTGIRVYKGEVQVMADGAPQIMKEGREMQFTAGNALVKFDSKVGDPLYRWANRRAEFLAMANIASAQSARKSYGSTGSSYPMVSGWYYNSFYGMMTYLPGGRGMYRSPFGYMYYSPDRVDRYYQSYNPAPPSVNSGFGGGSALGNSNRTWNSNNGYFETSSRSAGPVSISPGNTGSAPAAAAPVDSGAGRGADVGTSRGGGSGSSGK